MKRKNLKEFYQIYNQEAAHFIDLDSNHIKKQIKDYLLKF
jgi:hypothetical protein